MFPLRPSSILHVRKQQGAALMLMLVILVLGAATVLVSSLNSSRLKMERDKITADALAQAKEALIGYSTRKEVLAKAGYLVLPDTTWDPNAEGVSEGTVGSIDISVIGKLPWKTLGLSPLRDGHGECLWYILSGRFKNSPTTETSFNWDTSGQIDVIDGNGATIISNVAALIVSPGPALDAQDHSLANAALTQCGGNYDARNYLDPYSSNYAIANELNYFVVSTNNRLAQSTSNKRFVHATTDHYNDRFQLITTDDIFRPIIRRNDFRDQIYSLMEDSYFKNVSISDSNKGTDDVVCSGLDSENEAFCTNWREILLLIELNTKSSITIDNQPTSPCKRVLIFGGQKTGNQKRASAADKANPANYLESPNLDAFSTNSNSFNGKSTFNANSPSADVLKCIS